jgi:glyoxylase-like metal-dependent hydrolase (beta-lactamase superfamily II)
VNVRVGALQIVPVLDGMARLPADRLLRFAGHRTDPWEPHRRFLGPDGVLELSLGGFLVRTGDRVVLIDTGVGRLDTGTYRGGGFLDSLAAAGLTAGDVTDVVLTHLHFDHVGWVTQKGAVVFPRAVYRCHPSDWAYFVDAHDADPGAVRKLAPIADRLETFEGDTTVAPGITVRHAPGHTPGSAVVVVSDGQDRALLLGDVAHCPVELMEDDWEAIVDVDPELAARTRAALAREVEGTDVPVAAAHFPGLSFGRLLTGTGRRGWVFEGKKPAGRPRMRS